MLSSIIMFLGQSVACHVPDVFNILYRANTVFGSLLGGKVREELNFFSSSCCFVVTGNKGEKDT